jgi:hypothetical protein
MGNCIAYVFRHPVIKQRQLKELATKHQWKLDVVKYGLLSSRDGILLREAKAWLWSVYNDAPIEVDLEQTERNSLVRSLSCNTLTSHLRSMREFPVYSINEVDELIRWVLVHKEVNTYIEKFISAKFKFLISMYGLSRGSIKSDLQSAAISILYKQFPCWKSSGDMFALAKAAIHNRGQNIIKEHTNASKNQLITQSNGQYTLVNVSLDDMISPPSVSYSTDLAVSIRQLLTKNSFTKTQQRFLTLMTGQPDVGLSEWLGESNSSYMDRCNWQTYFSSVCKYCQLDKAVAQEFLLSLKKYLV